jgi:hypothetical protein
MADGDWEAAGIWHGMALKEEAAEARALLLDELEAAVRELPSITFTPEQDPSAGDVVYRADLAALIQQHREAIR